MFSQFLAKGLTTNQLYKRIITTSNEVNKYMAEKNNNDQTFAFQVERYKFILQEIHTLNENFHKYLILFQTLLTGILSGGVVIFTSWQNLAIPPEVVKLSIQSLLGVMIVLTLFVVTTIIVGVISWFDYRNEEVDLLDAMVGKGFRKKPSVSNIWRWHETYLIIFILVIVVSIYFYVRLIMLPAIK